MKMQPLWLAAMAALLIGAAPVDPHSPAGAVAVTRRYFALLSAHRYAAAYRLWGQDGRATGKSFTRWRAGFANTAASHATIGAPTDGEGAAGSIFITIPVRLDTRLKNGTRQHFAGDVILRRVNDVDGATPAQLEWHISEAHLKRVG